MGDRRTERKLLPFRLRHAGHYAQFGQTRKISKTRLSLANEDANWIKIITHDSAYCGGRKCTHGSRFLVDEVNYAVMMAKIKVTIFV